MKKITKYTMFFILTLVLSVLSANRVYAVEHYCVKGIITEKKCEKKEPNCAWVNRIGCVKTEDPTSTSPACSSITSILTCQRRKDCKWKTGVGGHCDNNPYYNEEINKRQNGDNNSSSNNNSNNATDIDDIIKPTSKKFTCKDVKEFTGIWLLIRVMAPFLVILFGSLDYLKATMAGDEKKMKEASGRFPKRLIAFVLLILLPFLVQFIFNYIGTYGSQNACLIKCIVNNDTSSKGCE